MERKVERRKVILFQKLLHPRNRYLLCVALMFLLAVFIRLLFVNQQGHNFDLYSFSNWSEAASFRSITAVYRLDEKDEPFSDYPPVYISFLGVLGKINNSILHLDFHSTEFRTVIKIFNSSIDIVCAAVIFLILGKLTSSRRKKLVVTGLFLFNPAIIFISTVWGQIDNFLLLFLLLAIYALLIKQPFLTGIFLALALLTKTQALIFIPVFAVFIFIKYKWAFSLRVAVSGLVTCLLMVMPFITAGSHHILLSVYTSAADRYPYLTLNAYNIWWFATNPSNIAEKGDHLEMLPGLSAKGLGLVLFVIFLGIILLYLIKKRRQEVFYLALSLTAVIFYMLPTQMHERYMYTFFGFFLLSSLVFTRFVWIYVLLSISIFINCLNALYVSSSPFVAQFFPASSYVLTVVNIICLVLLATTFLFYEYRQKAN